MWTALVGAIWTAPRYDVIWTAPRYDVIWTALARLIRYGRHDTATARILYLCRLRHAPVTSWDASTVHPGTHTDQINSNRSLPSLHLFTPQRITEAPVTESQKSITLRPCASHTRVARWSDIQLRVDAGRVINPATLIGPSLAGWYARLCSLAWLSTDLAAPFPVLAWLFGWFRVLLAGWHLLASFIGSSSLLRLWLILLCVPH
ncbi:hypothetical protein BV22DRAFT_463318 [Leucogyrophana mollusca]|uniref:Uncharacterized protein n=1 Tax=Leucogyrophana mollusca TaxID=85980 RepID=A0ACB8BH14_9AGAM|nr:hypothetical protein BV22DRAFT_463318 [Leucogyrophana mollusca]